MDAGDRAEGRGEGGIVGVTFCRQERMMTIKQAAGEAAVVVCMATRGERSRIDLTRVEHPASILLPLLLFPAFPLLSLSPWIFFGPAGSD